MKKREQTNKNRYSLGIHCVIHYSIWGVFCRHTSFSLSLSSPVVVFILTSTGSQPALILQIINSLSSTPGGSKDSKVHTVQSANLRSHFTIQYTIIRKANLIYESNIEAIQNMLWVGNTYTKFDVVEYTSSHIY